jgi:ribose transport system substrate-binding protein
MKTHTAGLRALLLCLALAASFLTAACGDDDDDSTTSTPSGSSNASDPVVAEAKEAVAAAEAPSTEWAGPTTGPKGAEGKSVACIMYNGTDITAAKWCEGVEQAAEALGWKHTTFDGKGTADRQRSALQSAIALKPDGIVLAAVDAKAQAALTSEAAQQGIVLIGIHSAPTPGPKPEDNLFVNISYNPEKAAQLGVDRVIADSDGKAQLVIVAEELYRISRLKGEAARDRIEQCSGCKLLEYKNHPAATASTTTASLFNSFLQKYDQPFYIWSISDSTYLDPGSPALRAAGVPPDGVKLVGADGSPAAYERITTGQYEIGTVPEPPLLQGWESADQLNRAFNGEEPAPVIDQLFIVTKDNIDRVVENGEFFDPENGYADEYKKIWGVD